MLGNSARPNELGRQFIDNYLKNDRYLEQLAWFEYEFKPALGIEVYGHPFDKQRGFARIDEGPYSALILKTELDDASKAGLVGEFLGLRDFQMLPPDEVAYPTYKTGFTPGIPGTQAPYGADYERLKSGLTIPERLVDVTPGNSVRLGFVNRVFPDCQIVHFIRDGIDNVLSMRRFYAVYTRTLRVEKDPDHESPASRRMRQFRIRQLPGLAMEVIRNQAPDWLLPVVGYPVLGVQLPAMSAIRREVDL